MWRTPDGERVLTQGEAALVRGLIGVLCDKIDPLKALLDQPHATGVGPFDRLEPSQQLALLYEVGAALLSADHLPAPEPTAMREATVAALFEELLVSIEIEIDCQAALGMDLFDWRRATLLACREGPEPIDDLPDASCTDLEEWELVIDAIAGRVLWDHDWGLEELALDHDPEASAAIKEALGIPDGYFGDIAPDPTERELAAIRRRLHLLTAEDRA